MIIDTVVSTIIQLCIFALIPFVVYLIGYRQIKGFFEYVGIKKTTKRAVLYSLLVFAIFVPVASIFYFSPDLREVTSAGNTVTGQLRTAGLSLSTLLQLLVIAIFKTSLTEEIFFRGFIAKRLIGWLGFHWGNPLQALIFGAIHLVVFIAQPFSILLAVAIVFLPTLGGWIAGYLMERVGNGSIVPAWMLHALINLVAYWALAFG